MIYVKRVMDTCGQRNAASWKCKITTPNGSTLHNYVLTDSVILIIMVENESRKITHDSIDSKNRDFEELRIDWKSNINSNGAKRKQKNYPWFIGVKNRDFEWDTLKQFLYK